jgi:hypothetical protein
VNMTPEERDRLVRLEVELDNVRQDVSAIRKVTDSLNTQSLYVRGALIVAIALGGVLAWASNIWNALR